MKTVVKSNRQALSGGILGGLRVCRPLCRGDAPCSSSVSAFPINAVEVRDVSLPSYLQLLDEIPYTRVQWCLGSALIRTSCGPTAPERAVALRAKREPVAPHTSRRIRVRTMAASSLSRRPP